LIEEKNSIHKYKKNLNVKALILVGDWNVVQDYNLDTINYRRENNSNSKLKLHSMMNDLDLINGQIDDRWINNLNARIGIRVIN
jgi:anionic cell wall polymer biosynthesis LytR-Cps2A-Psr (LCP) family protein